jgi:hypothetical protein
MTTWNTPPKKAHAASHAVVKREAGGEREAAGGTRVPSRWEAGYGGRCPRVGQSEAQRELGRCLSVRKWCARREEAEVGQDLFDGAWVGDDGHHFASATTGAAEDVVAEGALLNGGPVEAGRLPRPGTSRERGTGDLEALPVVGMHRGVGVKREAMRHRRAGPWRRWVARYVYQYGLAALEEARVVFLEAQPLHGSQSLSKLSQRPVQYRLHLARVRRR